MNGNSDDETLFNELNSLREALRDREAQLEEVKQLLAAVLRGRLVEEESLEASCRE